MSELPLCLPQQGYAVQPEDRNHCISVVPHGGELWVFDSVPMQVLVMLLFKCINICIAGTHTSSFDQRERVQSVVRRWCGCGPQASVGVDDQQKEWKHCSGMQCSPQKGMFTRSNSSMIQCTLLVRRKYYFKKRYFASNVTEGGTRVRGVRGDESGKRRGGRQGADRTMESPL